MLRGIGQGLGAVSVLLAKLPSIAYALLYLAAIPAFALIYYSLPDEFYHSTTRFEPMLEEESSRILNDLRLELIYQSKVNAQSSIVGSEELQFELDSVRLPSLRVDSHRVYITASLRMIDKKFNDKMTMYFEFSFKVRESKAIADADGSALSILRAVDFKSLSYVRKYFDPRVLFPETPSTFAGDQDYGEWESYYIKMSPRLNNRLVGFENAQRGFPSRVGGTFLRMLYLSAVTITTVGYGDILPLSNRARLIVAAEAIVGIILVGLFLNALFYQVSAQARDG